MASSAISSITVTDKTNNQVASKLISIEDGSDETKLIAARVLGVSVSRDWKISDRVGNLVMTHVDDALPPKEEAIVRFGHIHGAIVDIDRKILVAPAFGYPQIAVEPDFSCDVNGPISLRVRGKANPDEERYVSYSEWSVLPAEDGVVLRVFKHENIMYIASHTRINVGRSRWGDTKTFLEMYQEAKGPTDRDLFDFTSESSSTCYFFLLVHPELRVASRRTTNVPFLLYYGSVEIPREDATKGSFMFEVDPNAATVGGVLEMPKFIDCNKTLRHGLTEYEGSDHFINAGEAVYVFSRDPKTGFFKNVVKVCGWSYWIRFTLRGDNPNISHRYYQLLESITRPNEAPYGLSILGNNNVPLFQHLAEESRAVDGEFAFIPRASRMTRPRLVRASDIHQLYVWSLPANQRLKALTLYSGYLNARMAVADWLTKAILSDSDEEIGKRGKFIRAIMTQRHKTRKGWDVDALRRGVSYYINNEYPTSLYTLDRIRINNYKRSSSN